MTGLSVADAVLVVLVYVELVRFTCWAANRLGQRQEARRAHRRSVEAAAFAERQAERAHLVEVGNAAKFGLLRNAGLVDGEVRS